MRRFLIGDPVPDFTCQTNTNPQYHFNTVAGRYIILSFFGSAIHQKTQKVLNFFTQKIQNILNENSLCFFGVSIDPKDKELNRVQDVIPNFRFFWDFNLQISQKYSALEVKNNQIIYYPFTLILDPSLRVIANISMDNPDIHNQIIEQVINNLPNVNDYAQVPITAPILIVPRVFDLNFCHQLINLYNQKGGYESGFMREKDGKTMGILDYSFKRRQDCLIESEEIKSQMRDCLSRRLVPEIKKAFQFDVTRIERYIVACYDSNSGGFFRPHRDNTTRGTAHRRFAVTINLNAEEYEGGDLRFPEFGTKTYRAPTGGAVVFSCSLLHEATPVTKGVRYATLPFLYDESGAKIKEANSKFIVSNN